MRANGPRGTTTMKLPRFFFAAAAVLLLCAGGCSWPWSAPQYESYHPVIKDLSVYPGMRTREKFYQDYAEFWRRCKTEKPTVEDLLQKAYDLDTVLEAREKQIEAYNKWAAEQNKKNGYSPKEF